MTETTQKTVYCYSAATGEYAGETTAQRSPLDVDEIYLIPAWAAETAPPAAGPRQAVAWRTVDGAIPQHCILGGGWQLLPDWRGVPLWSKATAQPVAAQLGDTPDSLEATELEPPPFGVWQGKAWAVDTTAQQAAQTAATEAEIAAKRSQADAAIIPLQDAADLKMATTAEEDQLTAWRRYRVELSRVPQQSGYPGKIDWPTLPGQ
ncbi:tail fiber assembly protein [Chromobacterium sp. IIBBL 290-4]|uniref:tail fiber assembly protein n=1 Tax=Chromobacterium sp. IIBBL 290-4 TaxID=2953890 RepID=UPI0020B6F437|nr:tail fiber assembly protein [Chromobacterium sp. IIBBL 290-4]UTH73997.1 tail fiber assembly protein [Chromobacterium sp. IIBBL 290-4]